jgi:hypothetical protein
MSDNDITPEERDLVRQRTAEVAQDQQLEAFGSIARLLDAAPKLAPKIKAVLEGGAK